MTSFNTLSLNGSTLTVNGTDYNLSLAQTAEGTDSSLSSFKGVAAVDNGDGTISLTVGENSVVVEKEFITFTINSTTYTSAPNMTWEQWCNSADNTGGFALYTTLDRWYPDTGSTPVVGNAWQSIVSAEVSGVRKVVCTTTAVAPTDTITANGTYNLYNYEFYDNAANRTGVMGADNVGWLTINDTSIDSPVMHGDDNHYYATHDMNMNASAEGSIYLYAENAANLSDSYNIIQGYGGNENTQFGALYRYLDESYFYAHRAGVFVRSGVFYDLIACAVVQSEQYIEPLFKVGNRMQEVIDCIDSPPEEVVTVLFDAEYLSSKLVALATEYDGGYLLVMFSATPRSN